MKNVWHFIILFIHFTLWAFASCLTHTINLHAKIKQQLKQAKPSSILIQVFLSFIIHILFLPRGPKQQAVIEKFNLCEDNLSGLLKWIGQIEQKIASVGGPKEYIDELRNQINLLKVRK